MRNMTIGRVATAALTAGADYHTTLKTVRALFPQSQTTIRNIQWYAATIGGGKCRRQRATG